MALPSDTLATNAAPADFLPPDGESRDPLIDYEIGGSGLGDPSGGLQVQTWRARIDGDHIKVGSAPYSSESVLATATGLTEVALAFDQNMNPVLAYMAGGQAFLYWYDPTAAAQVTTALATDVRTPMVCMDDKRDAATQLGTNDVLLFYIRGASLYYRQQRERYTVERLLKTFRGPRISLRRLGMNAANRLQVEIVGLDNLPI